MADTTLQRPALMLVTDRRRAGDGLLQIIDNAVGAGVDVVQIREKDLDVAELFALAREIVSIVNCRANVVVNSEISVALELGIGLHLPESAASLGTDLVGQLGADVLIGRSVHSANRIDDERVDYLLFGHVFATSSKPDQPPRGLIDLAAVVQRTMTPVWAIGGITAGNAASVIERGARGIAVIGAILDADDPRAATVALRRDIDQAAEAALKYPRTTS